MKRKMLRILGRNRTMPKSTTMAGKSGSEIDNREVFEDLSSWEFVNLSDDEQDDLATTDDDPKWFNQENPCSFASSASDISIEFLSLAQISGPLVVESFEVDDCGDDDGGADDLDDELVPIGLSNKLGRQRIRKIGKRDGSRMKNSKRVPYYYNRPGCVRGKHGLGVHHSYI